jgi:hypothetical protein
MLAPWLKMMKVLEKPSTVIKSKDGSAKTAQAREKYGSATILNLRMIVISSIKKN